MTPKYFVLNKNHIIEKVIKKILKEKRMRFPIIIKPNNEGSSLGVKIIKNIQELKQTSKLLFKKYSELIIEQYIGGQEIQVAVLNNISLGAIELKPKGSFMITKQSILKKAKTKHIMPAKNFKK